MSRITGDSIDHMSIKSYKKKGSYIYIETDKGTTEKIFYTKNNEQQVLDGMKSNIKFNDIKLDIQHIRNEKYRKRKIDVVVSSICVFIVSTLLIKRGIDPNTTSFVYTGTKISFGVLSTMFLNNSLMYEKYKRLVEKTKKFKLFFDNEEEINKLIKDNIDFTDELNKESKKEIVTNISEKMETPVTVNSVNKMKLKELERLLEKMQFYQDHNLETPQDVIDDYNGNIDDLSEKYDSIEVEKPKKKKHLLER